MSISRRLAAHRQAIASAETPELPGALAEENIETPSITEEEQDMPETIPVEQTEAYRAGLDAGVKASTDRMNEVFASEHFAGREVAATKYLRTDMTASQIVTVLADLPKAEASVVISADALREAAEEAGRAEARAALADNMTSNIDPTGAAGGGNGQSKAEAILADQRAFTGRKAPK